MTTVDSDPFDKLPSVDVDDEGGARAAAEHLAGLGHRDVLIIAIERAEHAPKGAEDTVSRRLRGYRAALAARRRRASRTRPSSSVPRPMPGAWPRSMQAWGTGRRPTAILAMSDAIAIGAIRGLRDRGLSIPADVSVVGFDDIELAETTDPPLTTVHQPIRGKGEEAARLLLSAARRSRGARRSSPAGDPSHRQGIDCVGAATAREVTGADRRSSRDAARPGAASTYDKPGSAVERTTNGRPSRPSTSTWRREAKHEQQDSSRRIARRAQHCPRGVQQRRNDHHRPAASSGGAASEPAAVSRRPPGGWPAP